MAMIDAILFDIGNVLVQWDPRHLYRKVLPDEGAVDRFLSEVCTLEWHFAHDQGVSFEDNALALKKEHPDHAELIDLWGARYLEMSPGEVPGISAVMDRAESAGLVFHGLTNMPSSVFPKLTEAFPPVARLETVVVSGDENICKPKPDIFRLAIARMKMDPARTLYVDDTLVNADAAGDLGLIPHHFTSAEGLDAHLTRLGVFGAA
jgi:FMN phosphatase YigB (HAD superfamily)